MPKAWVINETQNKLFALEFLSNWRNATKAYEAVYGKKKTDAVTYSCASRLLNSAKVKELIQQFEPEIIDDKKKHFEEVLSKFIEVRERCMQARPVMVYDKQMKEYVQARDEDGNNLRTFDAGNAIGANREAGKMLWVYEEDNTQKGKLNITAELSEKQQQALNAIQKLLWGK